MSPRSELWRSQPKARPRLWIISPDAVRLRSLAVALAPLADVNTLPPSSSVDVEPRGLALIDAVTDLESAERSLATLRAAHASAVVLLKGDCEASPWIERGAIDFIREPAPADDLTQRLLLIFGWRQDREALRGEAQGLLHTKAFLEKLIQSSPDPIIVSNMQGKILLFNEAAERVCQCPADEAMGMHVQTFYPPGGARSVMRQLRDSPNGRIETSRQEMLTRAGELVPISLSAALLREDDKEVGTIGIFSDLRERLHMEKRLSHTEEQLQERDRQAMIVELAGTAAHELNQPLTSIMGYAELMRRRFPENDPNYHSMDVIYREAERMADIVRKIGKITRYETKPYVGSVRIVDLERASQDGTKP